MSDQLETVTVKCRLCGKVEHASPTALVAQFEVCSYDLVQILNAWTGKPYTPPKHETSR
jgi:hypothetical protein